MAALQRALRTRILSGPTTGATSYVIITSSPLRISLGGGGTDLPSYYREHTGFLIAAAINKYVYITLHEPFSEEIIVKYSKLETVKSAAEIKHPIVREALQLVGIDLHPHLEIASMADIPAGTGLGSSGSFTTALLRALHCLKRQSVPARELAEQACHIELERLAEPIGKQDQYIAAVGGLTCFTFHPDGSVDIEPLRLAPESLHTLEDNLILFFTGFTRSASQILADQDSRSKQKDSHMLDNLHFIKQLAFESRTALENGDLRRYAELMHTHWEHKKKRSQGMSNPRIDELYDLGRANGALGGKLIGAGGGGFLMFYTEDKTRLRHVMIREGLREVRFRFDFSGSQVIVQS
jgi:D-glycero-alpha-D-manno-heptose-7-phosphate kinase